jgi:hypothetical protein
MGGGWESRFYPAEDRQLIVSTCKSVKQEQLSCNSAEATSLEYKHVQ